MNPSTLDGHVRGPRPVQVRPAGREDAAEVRRLTEGFDPGAAEHPPELFAAEFARLVAADDHLLVVLDAGDRLVGYAMAQDQGGGLRSAFTIGRLHDMYVEASERGTGLGRQLMAAVERWARSRSLPMILDWQASPGAVGFYESLGYEPDREGDYATYPGFCLDLRTSTAPA